MTRYKYGNIGKINTRREWLFLVFERDSIKKTIELIELKRYTSGSFRPVQKKKHGSGTGRHNGIKMARSTARLSRSRFSRFDVDHNFIYVLSRTFPSFDSSFLVRVRSKRKERKKIKS